MRIDKYNYIFFQAGFLVTTILHDYSFVAIDVTNWKLERVNYARNCKKATKTQLIVGK